MANELMQWSSFLTSNDKQSSFHKFLDTLVRMDDSDPSQWVKWKNYANQVVVQSPNYFYKMYQTDIQNGEFICDIRNALAEIYREDFGIVWDIITIKDKDCYYQIEQREKLPLCTPELIPFEDLLIDWSYTLQKLEKKLDLPKVSLQLREQCENVKQVKLIRDCVNKYIDYGYKNGHVILLDDADWFLAPIDNDNNWISLNFNVYPVFHNCKDRIFAPIDFYDRDPVAVTAEPLNKWSIFNNTIGDTTKFIPNLLSIREQMLKDNIHIICEKNAKCLSKRSEREREIENCLLRFTNSDKYN